MHCIVSLCILRPKHLELLSQHSNKFFCTLVINMSSCKMCEREFMKAMDPFNADPGPADFLRPLVAGSKFCKACNCYIKIDSETAGLPNAQAFAKVHATPESKEGFRGRQSEYEAQRRSGKRPRSTSTIDDAGPVAKRSKKGNVVVTAEAKMGTKSEVLLGC